MDTVFPPGTHVICYDRNGCRHTGVVCDRPPHWTDADWAIHRLVCWETFSSMRFSMPIESLQHAPQWPRWRIR